MDLAEDFSKLPFDEVIKKSRGLVKKYYSCYPFLSQIVVLWLNHFMISGDKDKEIEVLNSIIELSDHIIKSSSDVSLYEENLYFKAIAKLYLGRAQEVIEDLEPILNKKQLTVQYEPILIQAYQSIGEISKAEIHSQKTVYKDLMNLISNSMAMINLKIQDSEFCDETINRIRKVIEAYEIKNLHPNIALQFNYQETIFYSVYGDKEKALKSLREFVNGSLKFIEEGIFLHGDKYFNRLEEWFEEFPLKTEAPRNGKIVMESLLPALENPSLSILFDEKEYKELKMKIERRKESK
ncbi:XRE family transcriptional regulator [Clostridium sp. AL.422]|uniref:XRE family transcriptional regulator n=1 Tax=Clostridium TaxID=1485 RepID=UPI00293DCF41|nr:MULTISPECIES: XRE family transcriptional regulator [unclassified Clostridium]MDV4152546.1 XRE family transcriptional regulator [Clostridium sp. AL.422]